MRPISRTFILTVLLISVTTLLKSQHLKIDSVTIYGTTYGVKNASMFKSRDGKDSAIINFYKLPKSFVYWDRYGDDCVEQSGAEGFSMHDVIRVTGDIHKLNRTVLKNFIDKIYFDSSSVHLDAISIWSDAVPYSVMTVQFKFISKSEHYEYALFAPHSHLKLGILFRDFKAGNLVIVDEISFHENGGIYYLPYSFLLIPKK